MAALVQTYPQQTTTVTALQGRPSSIMMPAQAQGGQPYMAGHQAQRNFSGGMSGPVYRGTVQPVQPYAFTSTPNLHMNTPYHSYGTHRTTSSPAVPTVPIVGHAYDPRARNVSQTYAGAASYNPSYGVSQGGSRDDLSLPQPRNMPIAPRPQSAYMTGAPMQMTFAQAAAASKPQPDRYRRPSGNQPRPAVGTAVVGSRGPVVQNRPASHYSAVDDMQLNRQHSSDDVQRLRRRSMANLDTSDAVTSTQDFTRQSRTPTPKNTSDKDQQKTLRLVPGDPNVHMRTGSSDSGASSMSSSHSRPSSRPSSSANRNVSTPTGAAAPSSTVSSTTPDDGAPKQDYPKLVNIPARSSSSDAAKRTLNPSPLSRPVTMATDSAAQNPPASSGDAPQPPQQQQEQQQQQQQRPPSASSGNLSSPAAQHLAAINQKSAKSKSKTSRLRRAFSFGSAADFNKAAEKTTEPEAAATATATTTAAPGNNANNNVPPSRLHKEPTADELYDAEQAAIAKKQEASGLGNSIYGGRIFTGSTDNISVSSTASSASIMIRKMGRGMKKSTRSLVGLFRPKSVIGVPPADAPLAAPEASQASVSMITVEAERVNVNPDPTQNGGTTGFPHLERNSMEMDLSNTSTMVSERLGSSGTDNSAARKSVVGGDKERAEVLAAVRKGILKHHSGRSSPSQDKSAFTLPAIPQVSDSPLSSAPSTPNEETYAHKRTGSVAIGSEDYFVSALRLRQDTKSAPTTPQGGAKRNATFSPRIVFHDTWPSGEYDRRGDIATCNRLTPMLAQQIKEELNSFKMEMEVHENSKIYTHFF